MKVKNHIFDSSYMQTNQSFLQKNTNFDFFAARARKKNCDVKEKSHFCFDSSFIQTNQSFLNKKHFICKNVHSF